MKSFFKLVSANIVALIIAFGVLMAGAFAFLVFISVATQQKGLTVAENSLLIVPLDVNLADSPAENSLQHLVEEAVSGQSVEQVYLLELIDAIDQAGQDDRIAGLYLHGSFISENYGSGYAVLKELRRALEGFKATGKPVYGYTVSPSLRDYYVLSAADHLYLNPFGLLPFNGMASEMLFFGQALERYGVGIQTTRAGKYKSAVEIFTRENMSDANRYQIQELLDDLWAAIKTDVAASRGIPLETLTALSEEQAFFKAEDAQTNRLVDEVAYLDEVITALQEKHGKDLTAKSFKQVRLRSYINNIGLHKRSVFQSNRKIAVVYAEGDIVDGEGDLGQVGGDTLARRIRALRKDDTVKAMVLRVNSPGGSAVASELIQREVRKFKQAKPVVVSMGSLAASGGYWISTYADKIYAEPSTITGSIGVFGILFNVGEIANRWGLTFDGVKTAEYSDIYTISRPKDKAEMDVIQSFTDHIYDAFLQKVAEGRGLSLEQVNAIAQGRVWTGMDAIEVGLVDEMGGLEDAIAHAVELAGLGSDWGLQQVPEKQDLATQIESMFEHSAGNSRVSGRQSDVVEQAMRTLQRELNTLRSFNDPKGVYARLPFELILR